MSNYSYVQVKQNKEDPAEEPVVCEVNVIHEDRVKAAVAEMIDDEMTASLAQVFQTLGDPTRLKLISALMTSEMCVCDLAASLSLSQSAVSHQLRLLRALRLVKNRKEGRVVYYSLDDDHIRDLFRMGVEHYRHSSDH